MLKRRRLFNREPRSLEDHYFSEIRPRLYELHATHGQYGSRKGRTLAEHLDCACQFVLTVSKIAQVPEEHRGCILAATSVHDLNKLDADGRRVKSLARDLNFLKTELERACVADIVKTDDDLEVVRRLIERHSGHSASDGMRFLPEDPNMKRWAAMLIGADLFDLGIDKATRIRKVENELTVAFGRPSQLFEVRLSEDRGYLTSLLLTACEDVLHRHGLHTLAIDPDGQIFEGPSFPIGDLSTEIAKQWQFQIDRVFSINIEQLVKPTKDGIKVDPQAIQNDSESIVDQIEALLAKKFTSYKYEKAQRDIEKYGNDAGLDNANYAKSLGLTPISSAEEFVLSEGLKAAYLSFREAKVSPRDAWDKIATHIGLSAEQRMALEPFNAQYGRCLFAAPSIQGGLEGIRATLRESFQLRQVEEVGVSENLVIAVDRMLNFSTVSKRNGVAELTAYTEAKPRQRGSLGAMSAQVEELISNKMPPGTKVQAFSNRLPGGMSAEPKRRGDVLSSLAYQLTTVGANFPKVSKQDPLYLHFALPQGSSSQLQHLWRQWLEQVASTNAEGGTVTFDELKLYRDSVMEFKAHKVVGAALPKRPEFIYSTVAIPVVWGDVSYSLALLKSLRLALELSLAPDFGFPFILSANLEVETAWNVFGKAEGIPSALQPLLGQGLYHRQGHLPSTSQSLTAEQVLERLQGIGQLAVGIASLRHKDDCLYDLARAVKRPLNLYRVLLRWSLREQDDPNLSTIWNRIREPLNRVLENLMSEENKNISHYLRQATRIAVAARLRGSSFRRTAQAEPFTAFIKAIRSRKPGMDWDTVFAALVQEYHTRLDRILEYDVGATKFEQIKQFYSVLKELFEEVYHSRPERILADGKTLEAAYLFFLQEARQELRIQAELSPEANA